MYGAEGALAQAVVLQLVRACCPFWGSQGVQDVLLVVIYLLLGMLAFYRLHHKNFLVGHLGLISSQLAVSRQMMHNLPARILCNLGWFPRFLISMHRTEHQNRLRWPPSLILSMGKWRCHGSLIQTRQKFLLLFLECFLLFPLIVSRSSDETINITSSLGWGSRYLLLL